MLWKGLVGLAGGCGGQAGGPGTGSRSTAVFPGSTGALGRLHATHGIDPWWEGCQGDHLLQPPAPPMGLLSQPPPPPMCLHVQACACARPGSTHTGSLALVGVGRGSRALDKVCIMGRGN